VESATGQITFTLSAFSNISRVSMGVPWRRNLPVDENSKRGSTALHCNRPAVDALYLRASDRQQGVEECRVFGWSVVGLRNSS
jgi:hypothetical protein